ncbi:hypothetical protein BKA80DRAFT_267763 [Phyllosticta citrichinensis]
MPLPNRHLFWLARVFGVATIDLAFACPVGYSTSTLTGNPGIAPWVAGFFDTGYYYVNIHKLTHQTSHHEQVLPH